MSEQTTLRGSELSVGDDLSDQARDISSQWLAELPPRQQAYWSELHDLELQLEDAMYAIIANEAPDGAPAEWIRLIQDTRAVYISSRGAKEVASEHGMSVRELHALLAGLRVLNVGVGNSTIAADLLAAQIPAEFTSVDIDARVLRQQPGIVVQASADNLPFADGRFDAVLMTCSLPLWASSPEQAMKALDESLRMLAMNGVLKLTPIGQARNRYALDKRTREPVDDLEDEPDVRIQMILCAIDLATIAWLRAVTQDPHFEVTIESAPRCLCAMVRRTV